MTLNNNNSPLTITNMVSEGDHPSGSSLSTPTSNENPRRAISIEALINQDSSDAQLSPAKRKLNDDQIDFHTDNKMKKQKTTHSSQPSSPRQMASNLRTRLTYAMIKLQNGWESQSLARIERNATNMSNDPVNPFHLNSEQHKRPSVSLQASPVLRTTPLVNQDVSRKAHRRTNSEPGLNLSTILSQKTTSHQVVSPITASPTEVSSTNSHMSVPPQSNFISPIQAMVPSSLASATISSSKYSLNYIANSPNLGNHPNSSLSREQISSCAPSFALRGGKYHACPTPLHLEDPNISTAGQSSSTINCLLNPAPLSASINDLLNPTPSSPRIRDLLNPAPSSPKP